MTLRPLIAASLAVLLAACGAPRPTPDRAAVNLPPVETVPEVDLQRYAGKWFEVAHFPMFFQQQCVSDTTAHYLPDGEGGYEVINRCRTRKGVDEADGSATVVPDSGNAKLKISLLWPFRGDYWIIGLHPDYRWAVVGTPDRKYLWVLSRSPEMPRAELDKALGIAREQGYDLDKLMYTPHDKGV